MEDILPKAPTSEANPVALQEYFFIQGVVHGMDDQCLRIKSWSVTVSSAAIATGFVQKSLALFLLASLSSFIFWLIETFWKYYQYIYIERLREIELSFNNSNVDYSGPKIGEKFKQLLPFSRERVRVMLDAFMFWNVLLPHVVVVAIGLILPCLYWFGFLTFA